MPGAGEGRGSEHSLAEQSELAPVIGPVRDPSHEKYERVAYSTILHKRSNTGVRRPHGCPRRALARWRASARGLLLFAAHPYESARTPPIGPLARFGGLLVPRPSHTPVCEKVVAPSASLRRSS